MSIPKRIFYVWGANESKPRDVLACIQTWREHCADYEIIEINENSMQYFNFQKELNDNKWFKAAYERKMFAYVADYIRIKTLFDNGGIYLDTDVSVIKSFDQFLYDQAFVGIQCSLQDGRDNLVEPAILGALKGNQILSDILKFYNEKSSENIWNSKFYNMPEIFKFVLEKRYEKQNYPKKEEQNAIIYNDITLYPEKYFIPFRYGEKFLPNCITDKTHTIHWFGGSWTKSSVVRYLENKWKKPDDIIYRKISLIGIPILKIKNELNSTTKNVSFCGVSICKYGYIRGKFRVLLFGVLPLIKVKKYWGGIKEIYLFGLIPVIKYC